MEELYEFSSRYADVPVDVVQGFIDQPYSPDCDAILGDILRLDLLRKLDSALQRQEHHRSVVDRTTGSTDAPAALKRICAAVQHTMLQTKESAGNVLSSSF